PRTFDDLFTNLVEVGETGGILDTVFQRLAAYIEKAAALKRKVKSAMIYPASIIGVAFLVVVFMLTFVIPTFTKMFKDLGAELPRAHGVSRPMGLQMISVGEQTGALDAMLSKIADFYDDEVDTAVGALTALLEPIMIVILGVLIGGLVVAMYLPIFKLVTLVK